MNYYSLRLKTGEMLACCSESGIDTTVIESQRWVTVDYPVMFESFKFPDYETGQVIETVSMMPFIPISDDTAYAISTDSIVSVGSLRASATERYIKYLEQMQAKIEASLATEDDQPVYDDYLDDDQPDPFEELDTKILH